MNQELLELRWGRTIDQKWSQCMGHLVRYHPVTVKADFHSYQNATRKARVQQLVSVYSREHLNV